MNQPPRFAFRGNQVVPTPRVLPGGVQAEHAIGQRIPAVMIEEQPGIDALFSQHLLHLCELHVSLYCTPPIRALVGFTSSARIRPAPSPNAAINQNKLASGNAS